MTNEILKRKEAWKSIFSFLIFLGIFSSICHYAIVKLNPASIYVGALMLCPALAAIVTLIINGKPISSLPWNLKDWKYIRLSYLVPVLYVVVAYGLIWILGFGGVPKENTVLNWSKELGMENSSTTLVLIIMFTLLATVGVVKNIGSTLGEEIGWRGFFIYELRKVFSFRGVAIVSGLIWSIWHWPIIIYYGGGNTIFQITTFTIMILGMSVILAYYTFKSNSLWPAALYHSVHNIYIQKIFTPLTTINENTTFWIDEYGLMLPIITSILAVYFWRKAALEKL